MDPVTHEIDPVLVILTVLVVIGAVVFVVRGVADVIMHPSDYIVTLVGFGLLIAIGLVIVVANIGFIWLHEQNMMRKCMSAHERAAQARNAPEDYFGKQLRRAAAEEAEECARFAAKKQAEDTATRQ